MLDSTKDLTKECSFELTEGDWLICHGKAKEKERIQMVDSMKIKPGEKILDMACGSGAWTQYFVEKIRPGGKVIGIDIDKKLIDYANNLYAQSPDSNLISFMEGSFFDIPFEDNFFDIVFINNALLYLNYDECSKVISEMKRVTRSGGRIICKEFEGSCFIIYPTNTYINTRIITAACIELEKCTEKSYFDNHMGQKLHGLLLKSGIKDLDTASYAIQKVQPLSDEVIHYVSRNGLWYLEKAKDHLSKEEINEWTEYFNPDSDKYVFNKEDFYFCMLEIISQGYVNK